MTESMERPKSAIVEHLSGYNLPPDSLYELRSLYMKRFQNPFSFGLSSEGRKAMQQVLEEDMPKEDSVAKEQTGIRTQKPDKKSSHAKHRNKNAKRGSRGNTDTIESQKTKNSSFIEAFEKKATDRLDGDITDANFDARSQRKIAIGGKLETAMETIEIVKHGEPETPTVDGDAVKRNSVEKCLVWMEVNGDSQDKITTPKPPPT